ncbi:hypothetical protein [Cognatiyoonia sp. IB215182]|uniref:hypothetical protein n=1 Tax=Cognatiyoonia sp. IB215182 TaxID=3097353 RepID=UPI002A158B0A|nr:hypothetical protein [Cognatiyoonia sp. IB215182]MDX8350747.1 hypothetical protein [Cognatiyoonia sp. IB215182]
MLNSETLPWLILGLLILGGYALHKRKKTDRFSLLDALFGWIVEIFTGRESTYSDKPRKRRGPDMAFSAGRDPAHQNTRLRQIFIPMEPHEEDALRAFYLDILGLDEMRAPNSHLRQDGFWAVSGTRQIYLGTMPDFAFDRAALPAFPLRNIHDVADRLATDGYDTAWDRSEQFVEKLIVMDPAGNQIALIPA